LTPPVLAVNLRDHPLFVHRSLKMLAIMMSAFERFLPRPLWRLLAISVVIMLSVPVALADNDRLTARQLEIVQTVLSTDGGYINSSLHEEFWNTLPAEMRKPGSQRDAIRDLLKNFGTAGLRFQRETWLSAKASIAARRPEKTSDFESSKREFLRWAPRGHDAGVRLGGEGSERLILAAARHTAMETPKGPLFITDELVDQVLSGIDASFERFGYLSDPMWQPRPIERLYPDAHIRILWDVPFAAQVLDVEGADGRVSRLIMLTAALSDTETVSIAFQALDGNFANPSASLRRVAEAGLSGAGVEVGDVAGLKWRKYRSVQGAGSAQTSVGQIHAAVRVLELKEHKGTLSFLAVTLTSRAEAATLRDSLSKATQILD
jgi:hypothetical protein